MESFQKIQPLFKAVVAPAILKGNLVKTLPTGESIAKLKKKSTARIVMEQKMSDGSVYCGDGYEIVYNKMTLFVPHGEGSCVMSNGHIYIGVFVNGVLYSIALFQTKIFDYVGEFNEGLIHGHGNLNIKNDKIIEIECDWFKNQIRIDAPAIVTYYDGSKYIGYLNHSFDKHGSGIYRTHTGTKITGKWENDLLNGESTIELSDRKITCTWTKGVRSKICFIKYLDDSVYDGECDDKFRPINQGIMKYADNSIYKGNWLDGKKHGHGIYKYADNTIYKGHWFEDKKHGAGIQYFSNGDRYSGDWYNDMKHNWGFYRFSEGDYYNGFFYEDKRHGYGIYYTKSGDHAIAYFWENDNKKIRCSSYYY